MTDNGQQLLTKLEATLAHLEGQMNYPCIRDLVINGLDKTRFAPGEPAPNRQSITQYLGAWSRHAGLSEEASREWLVEYCVARLSSISRSSPSAIRHSTKSNLKYIFGSEVPFLCQRDQNPFHARCSADCPLHADMPARVLAAAQAALQPKIASCPIGPPRPVEDQEQFPQASVAVSAVSPRGPVKELYKEQFQAALHLAREEEAKGTEIPLIVALLNERGLKTRTGRKWTEGLLRRERKLALAEPGAV